jgi:hypothetical protein
MSSLTGCIEAKVYRKADYGSMNKALQRKNNSEMVHRLIEVLTQYRPPTPAQVQNEKTAAKPLSFHCA